MSSRHDTINRTKDIGKSTESLEASMQIGGGESENEDDQRTHTQTATMALSTEEDFSDGYATPTEIGFSPRRQSPNTLEPLSCSYGSEAPTPAQTSPCGSKSNLSGWESDLSVKNSLSALQTGNNASVDGGLREENAKLRAQVELLLRDSSETVKHLLEENTKLKTELSAANAYVDHVDVENEQQYSSMTGEIDELCTLLNKNNREIFVVQKELEEKEEFIAGLNRTVEQLKTNSNRQKEIIESLRDDLDQEKEQHSETETEKERLICEVVELKRKIEADRGEFTTKELIMSIELDDVQRTLEKQKDILSTSNVAAIVDKWERRVLDLENAVREREVMLHTQQQIINEMRRRAALMDRSTTSSGESLDNSERSAIEYRRKQAVLKYLTSDDLDKREMLDSVAVALDLTKDEEDYLKNSLLRPKKHRRQYIL